MHLRPFQFHCISSAPFNPSDSPLRMPRSASPRRCSRFRFPIQD
ncbi:unnamed protein product [Rhodiola kirilowii]